MIKFFTRKKVRKTGCISVGYIVCAHVGHYVKEVKSDVQKKCINTKRIYRLVLIIGEKQ